MSVVIPTYQRRDLVTAAVTSLAEQDFDQPFEVIVVVDGSSDRTADALRALQTAFPLTVLEQQNQGAASARNTGARRARGDIVLFLDDDMEADPHLLGEHDRAHRAGADAVLGHMPLHPESTATAISDAVAAWSEERLSRLSEPGAVLTLHDLLTGQLSVSAAVFESVGGFDSAFTRGGSFGNEDVDFGHRLLRGGHDIRFAPRAVSYQRYAVTPRQHLRQWRQAGRADVLFCRKHPEDGHEVFVLNGLNTRFARRVARPLAPLPLWDGVTAPLRMLAVATGNRRGRWSSALFFRVRSLEYWRGVFEAGDIPRHTTLRVLAYHAISDLRGYGALEPYGVPRDQFRRQLSALTGAGFHVISPREFAAFLEGSSRLPRRAVLLTFDDCYEDLSEALEDLSSRDAGGLAFAVSGLLGDENAWDRGHGAPALKLLDAGQLRALRRRGMEIGGHSRTHPILPGLSPTALEAEVAGCIRDLDSEGLGPIRLFAYPYGEHDELVREAVRRAGITAAFAIDTGVMDGGTDLWQIPRVEISRADRGVRFIAKVLFARQWGWLLPRYRTAAGAALRARTTGGRKVRRAASLALRAHRASVPPSPDVDQSAAGRPSAT